MSLLSINNCTRRGSHLAKRLPCHALPIVPLITSHNLSRRKMAKRRTSRHSTGRQARLRQTPRRSERLGSSEAPQTSELREGSLSVQATKQGVNLSPLASSGRQTESLVSSDFDTRLSGGRREVKENLVWKLPWNSTKLISDRPWTITVRPPALPCQLSPIDTQNNFLF